jgi:hypothetical protein
MKSKKLFFSILLITLLSLNNCGYKSVYSSKNSSLSINKLDYQNNKLNNKFARIIRSISNDDSKNGINLTFEANQNIKVLSKDKTGEPSIFEMKIEIQIITDNKVKNLIGRETFNNDGNKFKLNQYQRQLESQIMERLTLQIMKYLSNLK